METDWIFGFNRPNIYSLISKMFLCQQQHFVSIGYCIVLIFSNNNIWNAWTSLLFFDKETVVQWCENRSIWSLFASLFWAQGANFMKWKVIVCSTCYMISSFCWLFSLGLLVVWLWQQHEVQEQHLNSFIIMISNKDTV